MRLPPESDHETAAAFEDAEAFAEAPMALAEVLDVDVPLEPECRLLRFRS